MDVRHGKELSWRHLVTGLAMILASGAAIGLTQNRKAMGANDVNLETMVPREFGGWRAINTGLVQMDLAPRDGTELTTDQPYDQTLMRTYVRADGATVMLALAWGRNQRQEVKIHRPELCYVAQGFDVKAKQLVQVRLAAQTSVAAYRLAAVNEHRIEPITYWIRIGSDISTSAWQSRMTIFKEGLQGRIPDGMLVRVSQPLPRGVGLDESYRNQQEFLRDLYSAVDQHAQGLLAGVGSR